ncbi:MAG: EAL domain-containing protein [Deltaproteobacteria bacterium]
MSEHSIKMLLVVEDNRGDARLIREMFNEYGEPGTHMTHVERMSEAEAHLATHHVDVILLDLGLPDAQGLETLRRAHVAAPAVPLVVLTAYDDETTAAQALQQGAQDYLIKGQIETRGLLRALRYAVERKVMEEALFAEKERAQVTLKCIGDAVACTDNAGRISFLNLAAETMTGWTLLEALGQPMAEVLRIVDATNPSSANRSLVRRDGLEFPVEESVAPIHDRVGQTTGSVIVFRDVSVARAMAARLSHWAQHDFLTGLPNRMVLNDRIGQAIVLAARHAKKAVLLFLDLDNFKHINDSLGHPIGDKLLQSIAGRLVKCVRASDTVSRQGGDEFVVLLSEVSNPEDGAAMARRMLDTVAEAHTIDQHDLHVTTSIGISVYPDDGLDAETLIKNADMAMYQAKETGRQGYKYFERAMNARAVERQSLEEGLRRAVERGELELYYQPKLSLATGAITGAEALLRWTHPVRGAVSPAQFIPVAEDSGLIVSIGNWVLREACLQARRWANAGLPSISMAVNISAVELRKEGFLAGVFAIIAETGVEPALLELELTESVLMKHVDLAAAILKRLADAGVKLAVDDFGTGYSSLSYLRKFPINALKIDQSFVRQIATDPDEPLVRAIIGMGRALKLKTVAEGVETEQELTFLRERECDEGQGYLFSRPVPPSRFASLLVQGIDQQVVPAGSPLRLSV